MQRIVWILGAGFSRPLGGPLLDDLLRPSAIQRVTAAFPDKPRLAELSCQLAVWLFNYGIRFKHGIVEPRADGAALWRDAEEFLEMLDLAAVEKDSASARTVNQLIELFFSGRASSRESWERALPDGVLNAVSAAAKRIVAAETAAFTQGANLRSERWSPYVRWARELVDASNHVLTFNYDPVTDLLARAPNNTLYVHPPDDDDDPGSARVLKLHGSASWRRDGKFVRATQDSLFALSCADSELAIASPGPAKQELTAIIDKIWSKAVNAISTAECVVFMGYRFPPSDSMAAVRAS